MQGWFLAIMGGNVIKWDIAWEELQEEQSGARRDICELGGQIYYYLT